MDLPDEEVEVELRGFSVCRDHVTFGGRNGNVVVKSTTPEVLKGWRMIALNGQTIGGTVAEVQAALVAARHQSRYVLRFSTAGQRLPRRRIRATSHGGAIRRLPAALTATTASPTAQHIQSVLAADASIGDVPQGIEPELAPVQSADIPPTSAHLDMAKATLLRIESKLGLPVAHENKSDILPVALNSHAVNADPSNCRLDAIKPNVLFLPPPPLPLERASSVRCPGLFYDEIRFLASGAHGSAFLVKRFHDSNFFVAKKVDVSRMDEKRRQACLDEIGLLRRIRHDCIAEYVDFLWTSEDRTDFWLVLKHYPGGDLQQRINDCRSNGEQLDRIRVRVWVAQLCLALEHVHALRIVHNDVKGSNMFLTGANNVVLGDFGISEELEPDSPSSTCHAGSPAFMAPERWDGECGSFTTDMWSVGIVAYELIALRRPFVAHSLAALVYKLSSEEPEALAEEICSTDLWELIVQLLSKRPDARPSAEEALQFSYLRYCVEDLLRCHRLFEKTADSLSRTKETLAEAERYIRRALGQDSSSSESESEDMVPVDEVLTLRSRNSWDDPASQQGPPIEFTDTDSWHRAEAIEGTLIENC